MANNEFPEKQPLEQRQSALVQADPNGPIPSPAVLTGYNEVQPGLAERIVAMAEQEQAHRHSMASQLAQLQAADRKAERTARLREQIFGLSVGVTAIITGSVTAILGQSAIGGMVGCTGIAGFVLVFAIGRWMKLSGGD